MSGDRIGYTYTLTPIINFLIFCLIDIKLQLRCHGSHQHFCSFTFTRRLSSCACLSLSFSTPPSLSLLSVPQSFPSPLFVSLSNISLSLTISRLPAPSLLMH